MATRVVPAHQQRVRGWRDDSSPALLRRRGPLAAAVLDRAANGKPFARPDPGRPGRAGGTVRPGARLGIGPDAGGLAEGERRRVREPTTSARSATADPAHPAGTGRSATGSGSTPWPRRSGSRTAPAWPSWSGKPRPGSPGVTASRVSAETTFSTGGGRDPVDTPTTRGGRRPRRRRRQRPALPGRAAGSCRRGLRPAGCIPAPLQQRPAR